MSGPAQNIHNIYDPLWEHDACGIGAVVNLKGTPSHATVDSALKIVEKLEHRAGKDAAGETGDGVGLMIQVPHKLMVKTASAEGIALGGPRDYGLAGCAHPSGGAGPEGPGLYALHLPVLCGPACRLRPWPGL